MAPARLCIFILALSLACAGCGDDSVVPPVQDAGVDAADDVAQPDVSDADVSDTGRDVAVDADDTGEVGDVDDARDGASDGDSGNEICGIDDDDSDFDGLLDCEEVQIGTDPMNPDGDDDGLNDLRELLEGTDPTSPDTDNDGLDDGREVDLGLDPTKFSTYDDGICDCDRWLVTACDNLSPEPSNLYRSDLKSVPGAPGGQFDVGNWRLALAPSVADYVELTVDGLTYTNASIDERQAAAVYRDPTAGVAGFLLSHTPDSSQSTATEALADHRQALAALGTVVRESSTGEFATHDYRDAASVRLRLTVTTARSYEQLRDDVLFALAPFDESEVTGLPQTFSATSSAFEVFVTVIEREYADGSRQMLTAAAVTQAASFEASEQVQFRMDDLTNTTGVGTSADVVNSRCHVFEPSYAPRLDFYWVVDHTVSMAENHYAQVRTAAERAFTLFSNSILDVRMGVTSMEIGRHGRLSEGVGWHTDWSTFEDELDAVMNGLGGHRRWGLQSARDGLEYMFGESGAIVPPSHEIRPDTRVITVFAAAGEDQSFENTPLSSPSGQLLLDNFADFFIDHGSVVIALAADGVGCGETDGASYREVASATGGLYTSLCASDIGQIFEAMVFSAASGSLGYELPDTPISNTLRVEVDGQPVPRSRVDGFDYFARANSIALFGSFRPERPDNGGEPDFIAVTYERLLSPSH